MREIIRWFNIDGPLCGIEGTFPRQRDRLVGERGFEPPTPWSRTRCSTRLSHSPTEVALRFYYTLRQESPNGSGGKWSEEVGITVCCAKLSCLSLVSIQPEAPPSPRECSTPARFHMLRNSLGAVQ